MSERGERGGASSARQKPGPYLSTNKESDDRRVRRPTNERQDERDRKAESEQSRDKQREETRLSGHGDLSRDHPRTHREGGGRARDHPQTTKEYRGYRSERRETHRDQKAVLRDDGPPRDSRTRDRDRDRDDDVSDDVAVRSDHTASKQASRSEEMTSQSRGAEAADRRDRDKSDVKTDKHGSGSATARQRLRYKVGRSVVSHAGPLLQLPLLSVVSLLSLSVCLSVCIHDCKKVWSDFTETKRVSRCYGLAVRDSGSYKFNNNRHFGHIHQICVAPMCKWKRRR